MHQRNDLAKIRKNAFDKSIHQLLAELDFAKKALAHTIISLRHQQDPDIILKRLEYAFAELEQMAQNRG